MVEYTLAEALDLLKSKLAQADRSLTIVNTDIDFLRVDLFFRQVVDCHRVACRNKSPPWK